MKNNYISLSLIVFFLLFIPIYIANALALPWEAEDMPDFIYRSFEFALAIAGLIAFGVLVFAGFRYMTSAGDPTKMTDAKDQIFAAFLGLIVLLGSFLILHTLDPHLIKVTPPEIIGIPGRVLAHGHRNVEEITQVIVGDRARLHGFQINLIEIYQPPKGEEIKQKKLTLWTREIFTGRRIPLTVETVKGTTYKNFEYIIFDHNGIVDPIRNQVIPFPGPDTPLKISFSPPPSSIELGFFEEFDFVLRFGDEITIYPDPCPWDRWWDPQCWGRNHGRLALVIGLKSGESEEVYFSVPNLPANIVIHDRPKSGFPTHFTSIEFASIGAAEKTHEIIIRANTRRGRGEEELVREKTLFLTVQR